MTIKRRIKLIKELFISTGRHIRRCANAYARYEPNEYKYNLTILVDDRWFSTVSNEFRQPPALSAESRLVYLILLGMSKDGLVYTCHKDIEYMTGLSDAHVSKCIQELNGKDHITRISPGKYSISEYLVVP